MDSFEELMDGMYGWKVKDGEVDPPHYQFPQSVLERIHYFNFAPLWEDGMTFMGAMQFIIGGSEAKRDYLKYGIGAWLPESDGFKKWYESWGKSARQQLIALALMYGYDTDSLTADQNDLSKWAIKAALEDYGYEDLSEVAKQDHDDLTWRASMIQRIKNNI